VYVAGWSVNSIGDHAGRTVTLGDLLERNADGGVAVLVTPWHMAVQHVGLVPPQLRPRTTMVALLGELQS